jgi:chemotaxis signal transduction protein
MRRRQPKEPTSKILTFAFHDLHLGLRIEGIQKVLRLPQIHKSSSAPLGIALVGEAEVLVLDLYQNLFQQDMPNSQAPREKRYFITVRHGDILYGIPTLAMPVLQEIPVTAIKTTPSQYREHDPLGVASHVFQSGKTTCFLLDPHSLWQALVAKQNIQQSLAQVAEADEFAEPADEMMSNFLDDFAETASDNDVSQYLTPTMTAETESMEAFSDFDEPVDTMSDFLDDFGDTEPAIALSPNQSIEILDADDLGISLESLDEDSLNLDFDDFSDFDDAIPKPEIPHSTSLSQES